jgi:hypothetical protein
MKAGIKHAVESIIDESVMDLLRSSPSTCSALCRVLSTVEPTHVAASLRRLRYEGTIYLVEGRYYLAEDAPGAQDLDNVVDHSW